jgi:uncharacterized Tic20 family protein
MLQYMNEPQLDAALRAGNPTQEERTWAMLTHLSAFAGLVLPFAGNILGPLAIWLVRREQSPFVAEQGRESLNFNISVTLAAIVCSLLVYVFIGILLGLALFVYWLAMTILAGIRAGEGVPYRYPFALRLIK